MEQVNCQLKHKVQKIVGAWYLKQNKAMQYHLFMIVLAECSSSYSLIFWIFCAVSVSVSVDAGETGGGKLQKFEMTVSSKFMKLIDVSQQVSVCVYVKDSLLQVEVD